MRLLPCLLSLLLPLAVWAQPKPSLDSTSFSLATIQHYSQTFPVGTQLALAAVHGDEVEYLGLIKQAEGFRRVDNHDSVFEIGSISKVFTSIFLAEAVVAERVELDDAIGERLGIPLRDSVVISYRQLANHSSGLPRLPQAWAMAMMLNPKNPYQACDQAELERYLQADLQVSTPPGEQYQYSNLGAGILGYCMERVWQRSYEALLDSFACGPYGLPQTTTQREKVQAQLVVGRDPEGNPTSNWDMGALVGAGGILSSTQDLARFIQVQFDAPPVALQLALEPTLTVRENLKVGLGWHLKRNQGVWQPWHNGGTGGYASCMALDREKRKGVVVLTNLSGFHPDHEKLYYLCFALLNSQE